jgi:hypothetical protein
MADQYTCQCYKRDQKYIFHWVTHVATDIIKRNPSEEPLLAHISEAVSSSALKLLSQLIARYNRPVPSIIFHLFESTIAARKSTHRFFVRLNDQNPDPVVEESNDSHRWWIDCLAEAFNVLGGEAWKSRKRDCIDTSVEDEQHSIFSNRFSILYLDDLVNDFTRGHTGDSEVNYFCESNESRVAKRKSSRKEKKNEHRRRLQNTSNIQSTLFSSSLHEESLNGFRIIKDNPNIDFDCSIAVQKLAYSRKSSRFNSSAGISQL